MNALVNTATDSKLIKRFTTDTIAMLGRLDARKHNNAVMTVYHAAQFGECYNLNRFFQALKVNDQTALKAWIVANFSGEVDGETKHWLMFTNKKNKVGEVIGFYVVKDTSDVRVNRYDFDQLLELDPFYNKDVSTSKTWDLNALLDMVVKAHDTITKKAEKENIDLPVDFLSALNDAKRIAVLRHVEAAAETVANTNEPTHELVSKPGELPVYDYKREAVKAVA